MKYNQPFGISDPEAAYVNGNPSTGTMGSIPPASSVEYDQREIVAVIKYAFDKGLIDFNNQPCAAPTNSDLTQLLKAIFGMTNLHKLQASAILYVNSFTGDDLLADGTLSKPFRTIQAAVNRAQATIDLNQKHGLTFHCTGTFTNAGYAAGMPIVYMAGLFAGQNGASSITFDCNAATLNATEGSCFYINQGAQVTVQGGTYSATATGTYTGCGIALLCGGMAIIQGKGWTFNACTVAHLYTYGEIWVNGGGYTVNGGAQYHALLQPNSNISFSNGPCPVVVNNNPNIGIFVSNYGGGYGAGSGITYSGASIGKKFAIGGFGTIFAGYAGPNYFPGNVAGTILANTGNGEYT